MTREAWMHTSNKEKSFSEPQYYVFKEQDDIVGQEKITDTF